jgi:hypothetical protein
MSATDIEQSACFVPHSRPRALGGGRETRSSRRNVFPLLAASAPFGRCAWVCRDARGSPGVGASRSGSFPRRKEGRGDGRVFRRTERGGGTMLGMTEVKDGATPAPASSAMWQKRRGPRKTTQAPFREAEIRRRAGRRGAPRRREGLPRPARRGETREGARAERSAIGGGGVEERLLRRPGLLGASPELRPEQTKGASARGEPDDRTYDARPRSAREEEARSRRLTGVMKRCRAIRRGGRFAKVVFTGRTRGRACEGAIGVGRRHPTDPGRPGGRDRCREPAASSFFPSQTRLACPNLRPRRDERDARNIIDQESTSSRSRARAEHDLRAERIRPRRTSRLTAATTSKVGSPSPGPARFREGGVDGCDTIAVLICPPPWGTPSKTESAASGERERSAVAALGEP